MKGADRINAFVALGQYLQNLSPDDVERLSRIAHSKNAWFTPSNVRFALKTWGDLLQEPSLKQWLSQYPIPEEQPVPKKVGLVMPGNIPLEGYHDILCALMSGHQLHVKLNASDILPQAISQKLLEIEPRFSDYLIFSELLKGMDAYIATANESSAQSLENYFRHKPHLVRRKRSSCAVLSGKETEDELKGLGRDMLQYWGLGRRSVRKLFVPKGYNFKTFFEAIEPWADVQNHHRWNNNYDYYKSIFLVNAVPHLDNGFLLLKEDADLESPVTVMHYQQYGDVSELEQLIEQHTGQLQCIVGQGDLPATTSFGQAQRPRLWDYNNGIDTLSFLLNL